MSIQIQECRKCIDCGSKKTYKSKRGIPNWYRKGDGFLCQICNSHLYRTKNRKLINQKWRLGNKDQDCNEKQEWYKKNRIREIKRAKLWYKNNPEKFKKYQEENKGKIVKTNKKYYQKNKEEIRIRQKKWKQENKEEIRIYRQKWVYQNHEKVLSYQLKSLSKLGFLFKMTSIEYRRAIQSWSKLIRKQANNICKVCGLDSQVSHHLIYKSVEPKLCLNINNGISLCKKCHYEVHGWGLKSL